MPVARTLWNRRVACRDGIELAADIILPGPDRYPTVVLMTPYGRSRSLGNPRAWIRLVDMGYALVTVDVRGRGDSEGDWTPWLKRPNDAYDVIEWAAAQPWSTADVGMVGGSYEARAQWWAAVSRPPHLRCITPLAFGGPRHPLPYGTGIPLQYWLWWMTLVLGRTNQHPGALPWEAAMGHTPLASLDTRLGLTRTAWRRFVEGEIDFAHEEATFSADEYAAVEVPVLIGVGWWDDQETFRAWEAVQTAKSAADCRLLVGAWDHAGNLSPRPVLGGLDVRETVIDPLDHVEQFLARHLKGSCGSVAAQPRCKVFLTGENRWETHENWPPVSASEIPLFLASDGDARGLNGDGRLTGHPGGGAHADTYVADPNTPVRDMSNLAIFAWADPPLDYRYLQRRDDVLVYTSAELSQDVTASGRYRVRLYVSSDRPDTDIFVNLSDVHPDGRAIGLAATNEPPAALRLRYRNGPEPEFLTPGEVVEIEIPGTWMHHVFKAGHRIRLTLSSSAFPLAVRNAGSGRPWGDDTTLQPQTNTVHHSAQHPSRLLLPVLAGALD